MYHSNNNNAYNRVKLRVKKKSQKVLISRSKTCKDKYFLYEKNVQSFLNTPNISVSSTFVDTLAKIAANAMEVSVVNDDDISNNNSTFEYPDDKKLNVDNNNALLQPWDLPSTHIPNIIELKESLSTTNEDATSETHDNNNIYNDKNIITNEDMEKFSHNRKKFKYLKRKVIETPIINDETSSSRTYYDTKGKQIQIETKNLTPQSSLVARDDDNDKRNNNGPATRPPDIVADNSSRPWSATSTNRPWSATSGSNMLPKNNTRRLNTSSGNRRRFVQSTGNIKKRRQMKHMPWLPTMSYTMRKETSYTPVKHDDKAKNSKTMMTKKSNKKKKKGAGLNLQTKPKSKQEIAMRKKMKEEALKRTLEKMNKQKLNTNRLSKPKYILNPIEKTTLNVNKIEKGKIGPCTLEEALHRSRKLISKNKALYKSPSTLYQKNYNAKYNYIKPHGDERQSILLSTSDAMYNPFKIPKLAKAVQFNFARRVDLLSNLMGNYNLDEEDLTGIPKVYKYNVIEERSIKL